MTTANSSLEIIHPSQVRFPDLVFNNYSIPCEARVLSALARGHVMSMQQLVWAVYDGEIAGVPSAPDRRVAQAIHHLRRKGYRIVTPKGTHRYQWLRGPSAQGIGS